MPIVLITAFFVMAFATATSDTTAPPASPAPSPSSPAKTVPTPYPSPRSAINLCTHARFFTWPRGSSAPVPADVQYANVGERFEIRRGPVFTLGGHSFYETTIPVTPGSGAGTYYWVSAGCFNPG